MSGVLYGRLWFHLDISERKLAEQLIKASNAALLESNRLLDAAKVDLMERNRQLEILSVSDHLTGLFNRLRIAAVLNEEMARSARTGAMFSVIMLDIDHFKAVNDTYGHQAGDQVLVTIARLMQGGTREIDVVGRWGAKNSSSFAPKQTWRVSPHWLRSCGT